MSDLGVRGAPWQDDSSIDLNKLLKATHICVPRSCRRSIVRRLAQRLSVVDCGRTRQEQMTNCLQKELTGDGSVLNAQLGDRCCSLWRNTSALCRIACSGALNSVTLSTYSKAARITSFCNQNQNADDQVTKRFSKT
uniref:Uncharacterized protein n=1 Tax=Plectus sambesii TaxID=2011161 RepID=A0A914X3L6_9BILA